MAVVMTFIKTTPGIAQHGVLFVENAISPTIGRLYVAKFLQGDKAGADNLVIVVLWLMKSGIQHQLIHRIPYQNRSLILLTWPIQLNNLSHCYKRQLELDTLTMTSPTQVFLNIQINGIPVKGKQDHWC